MKKLLLTLLASLLLTGTAWAEWVRFGSDNDTNFYIDPATIRKDGDIRRVWGLGKTGNGLQKPSYRLRVNLFWFKREIL